MHPIDHVTLTVVSPAAAAADAAAGVGPIVVVPDAPWTGTELHVQSFFGSGCVSQGAGGKWGVVCPRGLSNAGMTCNSPRSTLRSVPSLDTRYVYIASAEPTNVTAVGSWDGVKAWTLTHALTERDGQLSCRTTFEFGADGLLGSAINSMVMRGTLAANTKGNVQAALPFFAAHEVQEFGFYQEWLAAVYNAYHAVSTAAQP